MKEAFALAIHCPRCMGIILAVNYRSYVKDYEFRQEANSIAKKYNSRFAVVTNEDVMENFGCTCKNKTK